MKTLVKAFARRVEKERLPVEAVAVYQDGRLTALRRWRPDVARPVYSQAKSFTATAVGLALADGALSLADRPATFFPECLPENPSGALLSMTLADLLRMASGFGRALLMSPERHAGTGAPDFVRYLFAQPVRMPPGTSFCYSNGDTYLAGRMVEKRVGMTLLDFLAARVFLPLGIPRPAWEQDPQGHTFGASGLRLRLEDMAKLGLLYLAEGEWQGKRLLSRDWVQNATRAHIRLPAPIPHPWQATYGYQFWQLPYPGAYRADGLYGQLTLVLPFARAVIATQCAQTDKDRVPEIRAALETEILERLT